jgi:hypothetical protein
MVLTSRKLPVLCVLEEWRETYRFVRSVGDA